MLNSLFFVLLAVPWITHGIKPQSKQFATNQSPQALELRLSKPLVWKDHCLQVSIDRTNTSKASLFLPQNGVAIATSVNDPTNNLHQGIGLAFIPVGEISDTLNADVIRLEPGKSKHDDYCIPHSVTVVRQLKSELEPELAIDRAKEMRRQVSVRGRLKIYANYFPALADWQLSAAQREEMARTPPNQWKNIDRQRAQSVAIDFSIPCPSEATKVDCNTPPDIFEGEHGANIPDISH